ncbi:MAG: hypothetical protein DRP45_05460 [Candidatus Zixiibacteriota bacterium]|nr:MAG: hypothetical protein DRP45_05460 [candidate division Zixibacteria bacterium]
MRHFKGFVFGLTVLAVGAIWLGNSGCNADKPTQSTVPKDYSVYFWKCVTTKSLYVYHPISRQLDTLDTDYEPYKGIVVSADGQLLYMVQGQSIAVVDADSQDLIAELPYSTNSSPGVAVSPNNEFIAVCADNLYVLSTTDYSVVFNDTDIVHEPIFSADSRTLYSVGTNGSSPEGRYMYQVAYSDSTPEATRSNDTSGYLAHVVPTPDETKLLMYFSPDTYSHSFRVFDVAADTFVFIDHLSNGLGSIGVTSDGRFAFYGNPGYDPLGRPPPSYFKIFDIEANEIEDVVSTLYFVDSVTPYFFPIQHFAVTPDGSWLIATNGRASNPAYPNRLLLYNIPGRQFEDFYRMGSEGYLIFPR